MAAQLTRVLAVDGALLGFFSTAATRETTFTKFVVVDEQTLRHRPYGPVAHAVAGAAEPRHHQAVRRPARVGFVSAPDAPAGDTLPQTRLPVRGHIGRLTPRRCPEPHWRPGSAPEAWWHARRSRFSRISAHADHYAGTLKGVLLSLCPEATLVDITHDIPPHDVLTRGARTGGVLPIFPGRARSSGRRRSWRRARPGGGWSPTPATTGSWRRTTASCRSCSTRRGRERSWT